MNLEKKYHHKLSPHDFPKVLQSPLFLVHLQANCLVFISQICWPIVWSSAARLAGQLSGLHQPDLLANCLVFISQICWPIVWSSSARFAGQLSGLQQPDLLATLFWLHVYVKGVDNLEYSVAYVSDIINI